MTKIRLMLKLVLVKTEKETTEPEQAAYNHSGKMMKIMFIALELVFMKVRLLESWLKVQSRHRATHKDSKGEKEQVMTIVTGKEDLEAAEHFTTEMGNIITEREVASLAALRKSAMDHQNIVTVVEEGPFLSTKTQNTTTFTSIMENAKLNS